MLVTFHGQSQCHGEDERWLWKCEIQVTIRQPERYFVLCLNSGHGIRRTTLFNVYGNTKSLTYPVTENISFQMTPQFKSFVFPEDRNRTIIEISGLNIRHTLWICT
jgi:hypothetical protein